MIPDSLFFSPQSPVSVLSDSSFLLSKSSPILRFPFPSSPSPAPILSVLFPPLRVLSHPPPSKRKQRNDTKPSRRSRGSFQNGTYQVRQSA